jgi:hypothetical protein
MGALALRQAGQRRRLQVGTSDNRERKWDLILLEKAFGLGISFRLGGRSFHRVGRENRGKRDRKTVRAGGV